MQLLKFVIIWLEICQVFRLQNDIDFSDTPLISNEIKSF